MKMRPKLSAFALVCGLTLCATAKATPTDCASLSGMFETAAGYTLTSQPLGEADGWCIFDRAVLKGAGPDQPDISIKRLRIRGTEADGVPTSVEIDIAGLKVTPKITDTTTDDRLRSLFRLQTADFRLSAMRNETEDRLEFRDGMLRLSGGTEVEFSANLDRAQLTVGSVLTGALTSLDLKWQNDGRLLRPALEAAGAALVADAKGSAAVDAAREGLMTLVAALPAERMEGESADEIEKLISAMPQGRGRLTLNFFSERGIGATELALYAMSEDPKSPSALARLLANSTVKVDWQPGLSQ